MRRPHARARGGCASARRSRSLYLRRRGRSGAERNRELVGPRQLLEMAKGKLLEKDRRRSVEQRTSDAFRAADDVDEATFVKGLQHTAHAYAADLFDLGTADRLAIRDDGQCLQGRAGEPVRPSRKLRTLDRLR